MPESPLGDGAAPRRERPMLPGRSARRFQFMHALHAANLKVRQLVLLLRSPSRRIILRLC